MTVEIEVNSGNWRATLIQVNIPSTSRPCSSEDVRFAQDSSLEGGGFELLVPRHEKPGISGASRASWVSLAPARAMWQSPADPDEMRPAEWNGAASQGSGAVWSRCFSVSRCASSSFLSVNLAPQYWHQNGCHLHSGRFGGGSCALSTRLINLVFA